MLTSALVGVYLKPISSLTSTCAANGLLLVYFLIRVSGHVFFRHLYFS